MIALLLLLPLLAFADKPAADTLWSPDWNHRPDRLAMAAILAETRGQLDLAVRRYARLLEEDPRKEFAYTALRELALVEGRSDALTRLAPWVQQQRPEDRVLLRAWFDLLLEEARGAELGAALEREKEKDWLPWRAALALQDGRQEAAWQALELQLLQPIQQEEDLDWSLDLLLVWVDRQQDGEAGRTRGARQALDLLQDSPHLPLPVTRVCQARLFWLLEWDQEALVSLDRALSQDSLHVEARMLAGRIHLGRQEWALAAAELEQAARLLPGRAEVLDPLAWCLTRLGRLDEALGIRRFLVEAYPGEQAFWIDFSNLLQESGRLEESLRVGRKAIEVFGESANPSLLNNTAYLLADLERDLDVAHGYVEQALRSDPQSPYYLDTMGWILFRQGEPADALEYLRQAKNLSPGDAEILDHMGHVLRSMGRYEEARRNWEEALELDPGNEVLRLLLGTLPAP